MNRRVLLALLVLTTLALLLLGWSVHFIRLGEYVKAIGAVYIPPAAIMLFIITPTAGVVFLRTFRGKLLAARFDPKAKWDGLRQRVSLVLAFICNALNWPLALTYGAIAVVRRSRADVKSITFTKEPFEETQRLYIESIFSLVLTCFFLLLQKDRAEGSEISLVSDFLFLCVILRHALMVFIPGGFVGYVKRSPGIPVLKFAVLALCDFLTLTILFAASEDTSGHPMSFHMLKVASGQLLSSAKDLFQEIGSGQARSIISSFKASTLSEKLRLIASLAYSISIIKIISKGLPAFERTDSDLITVATRLAQNGSSEKSLEVLGRLVHQSSLSESIRAECDLNLQRYSRALLAIERMFRLDPNVYFAPSKDDLFFALYERSFSASVEARRGLIQEQLNEGVPTSLLALEVMNCWVLAVAGTDTQGVAAFNYFEDIQKSPIILATGHFMLSEWDQVVAVLEGVEPHDASEEILLTVYGGFAEVEMAPPQTFNDLLDRWQDSYRPYLDARFRVLLDEHIWHGLFVLSMASLVSVKFRGCDEDLADWALDWVAKSRDHLQQGTYGSGYEKMFKQFDASPLDLPYLSALREASNATKKAVDGAVGQEN